VIMTNQIIAGLMVDSLRRLVGGQEADSVFYDASSDTRFLAPGAADPFGGTPSCRAGRLDREFRERLPSPDD
jgi:hypothetical protein